MLSHTKVIIFKTERLLSCSNIYEGIPTYIKTCVQWSARTMPVQPTQALMGRLLGSEINVTDKLHVSNVNSSYGRRARFVIARFVKAEYSTPKKY